MIGWLEKEARETVSRIAQQKNSDLYTMDRTTEAHLPITNLSGSYQRKNAALAQRAFELLGKKFPVTKTKVCRALQTVDFPGVGRRFHPIQS